jgi:hypothetical protein
MTKGNNGKGRRKRDLRRISILCGVGFVLTTVFVVFREDLRSRTRPALLRKSHVSVDVEYLLLDDERVQPLRDILLGKLHLVEVKVRDGSALSKSSAERSDWDGLEGEFCRIDWIVHKKNPADVGIFRFLQQQSPDCKHPRRVDLKTVVAKARAFDARIKGVLPTPKLLDLTAVAFHESRCGSTLFANMAVAADPAKHRVYSEAHGPIAALQHVCGYSYERCSLDSAAKLLGDVVYVMSRSDDEIEDRVFFKFQSIASVNIPVFTKAFPAIPWMYIYREPVQVMMSQLEHGAKYANCIKSRRNPPPAALELVESRARQLDQVSNVEYCAIHLGALTETAAANVVDNPYAYPTNYKDLPSIFYDSFLPSIGVPVDAQARRRMEDISKIYSKGMRGEKQAFAGDTERKERLATPEIREASKVFLQSSYDALEAAAATKRG